MNNNIYKKYKEILNNQKLFFPKEYLLEPVYLEEKHQKILNNNIFNKNIFNNSNKSIINNSNNVNNINHSYQAKSLIKGVINSPVVVQPINNIRKNIQYNSNLSNKNIQPRNNNYLNQNIYLGNNFINRTNLNTKNNLGFNFKLK